MPMQTGVSSANPTSQQNTVWKVWPVICEFPITFEFAAQKDIESRHLEILQIVVSAVVDGTAAHLSYRVYQEIG